MIELTPKLKNYIEEHIDEIESNNFDRLFITSESLGLYDVLLHAGIDVLGDSNRTPTGVFHGSHMTTFSLPNHINTLSSSSFASCKQLIDCVLSNNLISIEEFAFAMCESLSALQIPSSVKYIGGQCFANCGSMKTFEFPPLVSTINRRCFYQCSALEKLVLPLSITTIGDECFDGCVNLKSITYLGTKQQFKQIKKSHYWRTGSFVEQIICRDGILKFAPTVHFNI